MLRTHVVSQPTTLKALTAQLASGSGGANPDPPAARLASLQRLNPHIADLDRIPAGTVVLVEDGPDIRVATSPVAGGGFSEFAAQVKQAAASAVQRVDAGYGALAEQQKEVAAALKSAAIRKQVDADADLQKLVADSDAAFKADQQSAKAAQETLESLQKGVADELALLAKLLD